MLVDFSKLNRKIVILKPEYLEDNATGEEITAWIPIQPFKGTTAQTDAFYVTHDNRIICNDITIDDIIKLYGIHAAVAPMSGREYAEAQKIRAETTYRISIRYAELKSDWKILYNNHVFDIISLLDLYEAHRELQIIAAETDRNGKE